MMYNLDYDGIFSTLTVEMTDNKKVKQNSSKFLTFLSFEG